MKIKVGDTVRYRGVDGQTAVVLRATEDIMFKIAFMENHPEEFTPIALTLYVSERLGGLAEELRKE